MESLLVVVAGVSLVLAAIMTTVAWRLIRDKSLRTSSRAEALIALVRQAEGSNRPLTHTATARDDEDDDVLDLPVAPPQPQPRVHLRTEPPPHPQPEPQPQSQPETRPQSAVEPRPMQAHLRFSADSWDEAEVRRTGPAIDEAMFASSESRHMSLGRWLALAAAGL